MSALKIVIEIDWKTVLCVTVAVITCMVAYSQLFYENDSNNEGR